MACPLLLPEPLLAWALKDICPSVPVTGSGEPVSVPEVTGNILVVSGARGTTGGRIRLFLPFRLAQTCTGARGQA